MGIFAAIVLILVAVGSVVFHFMSPWWWTEIASNWGNIDTTIIITFWVTGVVFVAVILFTAYCVWKFRYREGVRAEYEPENKRLEWWLTAITSIGVAAMLAPGLIVWNDYVTVPDDAHVVEVMGQQWQWGYRYPGEDGILGTTDVRLVDGDNPFGINPDDPNGRDDILIEGDDLHLPLDKPVKMVLRSLDVLHDFYVPQFRAKMDMVPGMVTFFWLTPTRTGTFDVICAELCGLAHYAMNGKVVVEEGADYQAWLDEQTTFADLLAAAESDADEATKLVLNAAADPTKPGAAQ
jgi:cytochrome c oxidase subunit 2